MMFFYPFPFSVMSPPPTGCSNPATSWLLLDVERFSDPGNASKPTAGPARTRRRADGLPGSLTPLTGRGLRRRALALEPDVTRVAEECVTERLLRAYPSCRPHVGRDGPRLRESEAGVGGAA